MSLKNFGLLEAVELAIDMEEEGIRFYGLAAEKVESPGARKLFSLLKDKEYEHLNTFRRFYSDFARRQGDADADLLLTDPEAASYLRAFVESAVFPAPGSAGKAFAGVKSPADAVSLGIRAEKDSILYYRELSEETSWPQAREILSRIIAEERKHLLLLSDMLRSLPGGM